MAHESFENPATAAVMNELFVNIKVDREERPDIDQIYMHSLHALGEQGGWPLTMFLTPEGEPIWGGTYFPNQARFGRPAFVDVLREVARVFREEPAKIEQNRSALLNRIAERAHPEEKVVLGRAELDKIAERFLGIFDPRNGGIGGAPKFPQCSILELMWRAGLRNSTPSSGDPHLQPPVAQGAGGRDKPGHDEENTDTHFFAPVEKTLERMSEGGIYDHLGGGFSRYSVDERWLVPHFEKMLYDNAQLLELLALAHARTGNDLFRRRAIETVGWLKREMTLPGGGFASSLDADSEGEEGKFYVWSLAELQQILEPDDAAFFATHYDATAEGNFESRVILNRLKHLPRSMEDEKRLAPLREKLLNVRAKRIRPGLDDKVLADWNGLMIAALANAGGLLGEKKWIELAARAFRFVAESMSKGERLGHSWREGRLLFPGLSSDYGAMIRASIALHQATGEELYLDRAVAWSAALERHHTDLAGGYFLTADDAEGLIVRLNVTIDDAIPNPNALQAQNLIRLAVLTGDDQFRERADRLFDGLLPLAGKNLFGHAALLSALDLRLRQAEIVCIGPRAEEFAAAALKLPFLDRTLVRVPDANALPARHPARAMIASSPKQGAAFICQGERCSLPVTEPTRLPETIAGMER